jgi:membrane protein DedA with SNARE-associated domain
VVKSWLAQLPHKYHQRATCMFDRHGLLALLAGRFLAFVRTLLPTMAGISGCPTAASSSSTG